MTKISLTKHHQKSTSEIEHLIGNLQEEFTSQYGLQSTRNGDQLEFTRNGVKGLLTLKDQQIDIDIDIDIELGILTQILAPQIEPYLKEKLDKYLD